MRKAYIVTLYFDDGINETNFQMPYLFNRKNAILYGEYKFRTQPDMKCYSINEYTDINKWRFYKLGKR